MKTHESDHDVLIRISTDIKWIKVELTDLRAEIGRIKIISASISAVVAVVTAIAAMLGIQGKL